MTPSARLQAVIDILDALKTTGMPADRFVRDFFRARRYAGSKDRAAISELVFAIQRTRSLLAWRMRGEAPRRLVIATLILEGLSTDEIAALFDGSQHGPARLSDDERLSIFTPPSGEPPPHVMGEYPPWLGSELEKAFGAEVVSEMEALKARAPVDLRTNTLKTTRDELAVALRAQGFTVEPTPYSPWGLRLPSAAGLSKLSALKLFEAGHFEFQDEAAQIAALLCAAKPGMRVLDYAAGAGGKTLALAAAMRNEGEITVHDIERARMLQFFPRAHRAGVTIAAVNLLHGTYDLVLLDSPCTGMGTWRRQPEQRWRLTPERLDELVALQARLLADCALFVKPGGRLVYATCSLLPRENEERIAAFLADHAEFQSVPAAEIWRSEAGAALPPGMDFFFEATPRRTATDGFFTAILQRLR